MKHFFIILCICVATNVFAQTYRMNATNNGQTINFTCPISGIRFADSGSGSTHYANGRDDTLTFCASSGKLLKFDFGCGSNLTIERIDPTDTLFIYNGNSVNSPLLYAVTGNPGNSDRLPYFDESSDFSFLSSSSCITFRFKADASNNNDGWDACVTCVDSITCSNNEPATDLFGGAPFICNTQGYCGNTSSDFGEDYPGNLNPNGGNCPSASNFLGTIENNSWLKFIADSTNVIFDFNVSTGGSCLNGIQTAIFSYDGSSLTRMSDCSLSDGSHSGSFQLVGSGLSVGDTYYIMTDGNAGDDCDFTINVNAGVNVLDAGENQEVCAGDPVNLLASGPSGATYIWNSTDGAVVNEVGQSQTFNPNTPTTYYVQITGGGVCETQIDSVDVTICAVLPIELIDFNIKCVGNEVLVNWRTATEQNNNYFVVEKADESLIFYPIGVIKGAGNSNTLNDYHFIDNEINASASYYRLKQVDFDGYFSISEIMVIDNCSEKDNYIEIFFSSKGVLSLNYKSSSKGLMIVNVYDLQGRTVLNYEKYILTNSNYEKIDVSNLIGSSIYLVNVFVNNKNYTKKILFE